MRTFSSTSEAAPRPDRGSDAGAERPFGSFGRAVLFVAVASIAALLALTAIRSTGAGLPRPFELGEGATSTPGDGSVLVVSQVSAESTPNGGADAATPRAGAPSPNDALAASHPTADAPPGIATTPTAPGAPNPTIPVAPPLLPTVPTTITVPTVTLPAPGAEVLPGLQTPGVDLQLPLLPPITIPPLNTPPVTIPDLGLG